MRFALVLVMTAATAAPAAPALSGNALVWVDAPLYPDASEGGPAVRFGDLDDERGTHLGYVLPVHVIGALGDFVEVEPTEDVQCAWWRIARPAQLASLRLFVKRADLAPVLTARFAAAFKDGSRIALEPGLAVDPARGGHAVMFHADRVPVDVPETAIGWAYAPHAIAAPPPRADRGSRLESAGVQVGPHVFRLGDWVARTTEQRGGHVLFPIAVRCASATVTAPEAAIDVAIGGGPTLTPAPGTSVSLAVRSYLPRGAKLTTATGTHVVATLATDVDVPGPITDARACIDMVLERVTAEDTPGLAETPAARRTLHLCAPASTVKGR